MDPLATERFPSNRWEWTGATGHRRPHVHDKPGNAPFNSPVVRGGLMVLAWLRSFLGWRCHLQLLLLWCVRGALIGTRAVRVAMARLLTRTDWLRPAILRVQTSAVRDCPSSVASFPRALPRQPLRRPSRWLPRQKTAPPPPAHCEPPAARACSFRTLRVDH